MAVMKMTEGGRRRRETVTMSSREATGDSDEERAGRA